MSSLTARFLTVAAAEGPPDVNEKVSRERRELRHVWGTVDMVVRWRKGGAVLVVMPWTNHVLKERIIRTVQTRYAGTRVGGGDAFALMAVAMEAVVAAFDAAIWSWRDHIRYFEMRRKMDDGSVEDKYTLMHELARHAINCSESLEAGLGNLEQIIEEHEGWCSEMMVEGEGGIEERRAVGRELRSYKALLNALYLRSARLEKRLKNEISLVSMLIAMKELD